MKLVAQRCEHIAPVFVLRLFSGSLWRRADQPGKPLNIVVFVTILFQNVHGPVG
jgi:hypothetical protein